MNPITRKLLCLVAAAAIALPCTAYAGEPAGEGPLGCPNPTEPQGVTISIPVEKTWENVEGQTLPDSIVVSLTDGENEYCATLTSLGGWKDEIEVPLLDDDGRVIAYTVTETNLENYTAVCTDPTPSNLTYDLSKKPTEKKNTMVFSLNEYNCIVIKINDSKVPLVWTPAALTETAQAVFTQLTHKNGLPSEITKGSPEDIVLKFISGDTSFAAPEGGGPHHASEPTEIKASGTHVTLSFGQKSVWAKFLRGNFSFVPSASAAKIINTYTAPTPPPPVLFGQISGIKELRGTNIPTGVIFTLMLKNVENGDTQRIQLSSGNGTQLQFRFDGVKDGVYTVSEDTTAIPGWRLDPTSYRVKVEGGMVQLEDGVDGIRFVNTYNYIPYIPDLPPISPPEVPVVTPPDTGCDALQAVTAVLALLK